MGCLLLDWYHVHERGLLLVGIIMVKKLRNKGTRRPARPAKTTSVYKMKVTGATRPPNPPQRHDTLSRQVCSLVDPFCQAAFGAKFPDLSTVRSMPYAYRYSTALTTDVNGNACIMIVPAWNNNIAVSAIPVTFPATFSNFTALTPSLTPDQYRIVSMGCILRSTAAPLSASGMVRVRGLATQNGASLTSIDPFTYNVDFSNDTSLYNTKETAVFFRRTSIQAQEFTRPSTTNAVSGPVTNYVGNGWGPVNISVIGGPVSSACLTIEVTIHYELTFADNDSMQLAATPAALDNTIVASAASRLQTVASSVFTEGLNYAASVVERGAKKAVMAAIGARFGSPQLALMVD